MRPSADEILRSVIGSFDEYIVPEVTEPFARSMALTISNLLRHVALRIEHEASLLLAEVGELRTLLGEICLFVSGTGAAAGGAAFERLQDDINGALAIAGGDISAEADRLGWLLQQSIRTLEAARPAFTEDDEYAEMRRGIRRYLRRSLEREGSLIVPAFTGERR